MSKRKSGSVAQRRLDFGVSKGSKVLDGKNIKAVVDDVVIQDEPQPLVEEVTTDKKETAGRLSLDLSDPRYQEFLENALKHRITKPVHEEEYDVVEKLLRQFDLSSEFGPVSGMTRLERWKRADRLGQKPPHLVKEVLETTQGVEEARYRESYLYGYV
jgi:hypothetical protein